MLRNKKVLAGIISIALIIIFSCIIITRGHNSQLVLSDQPAAPAREHNVLELVFSGSDEQPAQNHIITVERAVICLDIKDRQPVQECQRVNANAGNIFCWSMLLNGEGKKVRYIWYIGGNVSASSWLTITSNRFRAWCPRNIDPKASGPGRVDIVDEQGRILKSVEFEISPARAGRNPVKYS
jgi:hypothetical protein